MDEPARLIQESRWQSTRSLRPRSLALLLAFLFTSATADAGEPCPDLENLDRAECLLELGRDNIEDFRDPLTLAMVLKLYPADRDLLLEAFGLFEEGLDAPGQHDRALAGLTETLSWLLKGQALLANDHLQEALRLRFPSGEGAPPPLEDEIAELDLALIEYQLGLDYIDTLSRIPDSFDAANNFELTRLLTRSLYAGAEKARRQFALGINSPTQKAEAATELRRSVQHGYLGAAFLAATQSESEFQASAGTRIGTRVAPAVRIFNTIASGADPQGFHSNYVPFLPYVDVNNPDRSLRDIAEGFAGPNPPQGAFYWDEQARLTTRQVDMNQTALEQDLAAIRIRVEGELFQLSGVNPQDFFPNGQNLDDPDTVQAFLEAAVNGSGLIGQELAAKEETIAAFNTAYLALQNVAQKILIEQERVGQIAIAITEDLNQLIALDIAEGYANSISFSQTTEGSIFGPALSVTTSFSPGSIISGFINARREYLRAMQQVQIIGIDSAAAIKLFLLEQAERDLALLEHQARIKQANLRVEFLGSRLLALIDEWERSLEEHADAYFTDPGYRLEMEHAVARAHLALRNAQKWSFLAAQALGYDWADEFPGDAILDPPYNEFLGPEDVFAVVNALDVADYLEALSLYATWNFAHHGPIGIVDDTIFSLRQDILGWSDWNDACQCPYPPEVVQENIALFKEFIANHTTGIFPNQIIEFEFEISVADDTLFDIFLNPITNYWNVKIHSMAADFFGAGLIIGPADFGRLALQLGGMSSIRHYSSDWQFGDPTNDVLIQYDLEAMGVDSGNDTGSLRTIDLQTSLNENNWPPPDQDFDGRLARLSVAATRWLVTINKGANNTNEYLDFDNLEDIQFWIKWRHGQPEPYDP